MKKIIITILTLTLIIAGCSNFSKDITKYTTVDKNTLGPVDAAVIILEYSDYQCPYCKKAEDILFKLVKEYKIAIRIEAKDFVVHAGAQKAAEASLCAADQDKYWEYRKILYNNQNKLDVPSLVKYANDLKLNTAQFTTCLNSGEKAEEIKESMSEAVKQGVKATPTIVINERVIPGVRPLEFYKSIINTELAKGVEKNE